MILLVAPVHDAKSVIRQQLELNGLTKSEELDSTSDWRRFRLS